jgi:hypothetical protein
MRSNRAERPSHRASAARPEDQHCQCASHLAAPLPQPKHSPVCHAAAAGASASPLPRDRWLIARVHDPFEDP